VDLGYSIFEDSAEQLVVLEVDSHHRSLLVVDGHIGMQVDSVSLMRLEGFHSLYMT